MAHPVMVIDSFEDFLQRFFKRIYDDAKEHIRQSKDELDPSIQYVQEIPGGWSTLGAMPLPMGDKDVTAGLIDVTCRMLGACGYFFTSESWMADAEGQNSEKLLKGLETQSLADLDVPKREVLSITYCGQGGTHLAFAGIINFPNGRRELGELEILSLPGSKVEGRFVNLGDVEVKKEDLQ
jgi:hypothetical protein